MKCANTRHHFPSALLNSRLDQLCCFANLAGSLLFEQLQFALWQTKYLHVYNNYGKVELLGYSDYVAVQIGSTEN